MAPPLLLFAPGAGAPSSHPWMQHWSKLLARFGSVQPFDYDYMREGRRRPDPLPALIQRHREILAEARAMHMGPVILLGKSMGSRVGCHVALAEKVDALVCFGYPLCAGGDRTELRDKVLKEINTPILFLQGTRDALCPLDLLDAVRREMMALNELFVVEAGDHSLQVTKTRLRSRAETQADEDARICDAFERFLAKFTGPAAV